MDWYEMALGYDPEHVCCPDCADDESDHTLHAEGCSRIGTQQQDETTWSLRCARRVSSAQEDEDTYTCFRPASVEAFTTAGEWEPHCAAHVAGWPIDRVRVPK